MKPRFFQIILSFLLVGLLSCESGDDYIETVVEDGSPGSIVHTDWDHKKAQQQSRKRSPKADQSTAKSVTSKTKKQITPANKDTFQLQLGAFVNEGNANKLIKRIEKKGYQPYIEDSEFKGKKWHFVKIGPYRRQKDAVLTAQKLTPYLKSDIIILKNKALLERIKAPVVIEKKPVLSAGTSKEKPNTSNAVVKKEKTQKAAKTASRKTDKKPVISKPAKKTGTQMTSQAALEEPVLKKIPKVFKSKANPTANKATSPYSFQIGGLYTQENAKKQLKRFRSKGYMPYLEIVKDEITNEKWYSVRIGRFENLQDAVDEAGIFSIKEQMPAAARPLNY